MTEYSTRGAAKKLGLSPSALSKYLRLGKIPAPKMAKAGTFTVHLWTEEDIERVRKLLPKIANGRKTRHKKKQLAVSSEQSAKPKTQPKSKKQPQPQEAMPHKKK